MNRDDIIRMAREAGMEVHTRKGEIRIGSAIITGCDSTKEVLRFAALVAAYERNSMNRGRCIACGNHITEGGGQIVPAPKDSNEQT